MKGSSAPRESLLTRWLLPIRGQGANILFPLAILAIFGLATRLLWQKLGVSVLGAGQGRLSEASITISTVPPWIRSDVRADALRAGSLSDLPFSQEDLTLRVAQASELNPWVANANRVRKQYGNKLLVDLEYRRPVAMVEYRNPNNQVMGLFPVDANGNVTGTALTDLSDLILPSTKPGTPTVALANISIGSDGLVTATYGDGTNEMLGKVAMASFTAQEGLRPIGDAHWQSTGDSGSPAINAATNGPLGTIRSGALERANVDITEELVALIGAQRNFQANAKAIETASTMTQAIINLRT